MKTYQIPGTPLTISRLAYGGGALGGAWEHERLDTERLEKVGRLVHAAYDNGITLFDNADIYAYGKAEEAMGHVFRNSPGLRDKIVLQTKCGIHLSRPWQEPASESPHRFDLRYRHILAAVEGSLKRLSTDRIDILLLHRPDPLMKADEVAQAFDELHRSGKVRHFGVSNYSPIQIELLKKSVRQPLVVNQVELGLSHSELICEGLDFNRQTNRRLIRGCAGYAGLLEYCQLNQVLVQAYSPVRGLSGTEASPDIQKTMQRLRAMASEKGVTPFAVALAWLLRHPAGIVPIIGTDKPEHLIENLAADHTELTYDEWYSLLFAATGVSGTQML